MKERDGRARLIPCEQRKAWRPGCKCTICRERKRASDREHKKRWRAKHLAEMAEYMRDYRAGKRRSEPKAQPTWRCDCGQLNQSVPCRCGVTPTWAKEVA